MSMSRSVIAGPEVLGGLTWWFPEGLSTAVALAVRLARIGAAERGAGAAFLAGRFVAGAAGRLAGTFFAGLVAALDVRFAVLFLAAGFLAAVALVGRDVVARPATLRVGVAGLFFFGGTRPATIQ
jgi:hypothetical protein